MKKLALLFLLCFLMPRVMFASHHSQSKPSVVDSIQITFQVDMSQWAAIGKFNPATDSLDMPGTFNNWAGSSLLQKKDSLIYEISLLLDSMKVEQFRFRINRDSNLMEFPGGDPRLFRIPGHPLTVRYHYNNFDTTTVPITFMCNMSYQITAHHFDPQPYKDFVDLAANFNNWGSWDVLFDSPADSTNDSIYSLTLNLPRTLISSVTPIAFKFRINGNPNTEELPDEPFRKYFLQDTAGGVKNVVVVWYNDQYPSIPATPRAYNVMIEGDYYATQTLSGAYLYEDLNLRPEGASIYKWYRKDSLSQVNPLLLSDSTINHYVDSIADFHKFLGFEVTPVAQGTGDSLIGKPVIVWTGLIGGVGIDELNDPKPGIFPNPVSTKVTFTRIDNIRLIEIFSLPGQRLYSFNVPASGSVTFDLSGLDRGIYFVKFSKADKTFRSAKFIKK